MPRVRCLLVAVALGSWLVAVVPSVRADGSGSYVHDPGAPSTNTELEVVATQSGVTIFIGTTTTDPGIPDTPGPQDIISNPNSPECTATPMNIGHVSAGWVQAGLAANPGTVPWTVSCDNGYFGIAWVPTDAPSAPDVVVGTPPTPGVDPVAVAEALYGFIPLPPITLEANPGTGLVAMPSWFWVEGYGGETLYGAETLGSTTVEVEVAPEHTDGSLATARTSPRTRSANPIRRRATSSTATSNPPYRPVGHSSSAWRSPSVAGIA